MTKDNLEKKKHKSRIGEELRKEIELRNFPHIYDEEEEAFENLMANDKNFKVEPSVKFKEEIKELLQKAKQEFVNKVNENDKGEFSPTPLEDSSNVVKHSVVKPLGIIEGPSIDQE